MRPYIRIGTLLHPKEILLFEIYQLWFIFSYLQLTKLDMLEVLDIYQMMFPYFSLPSNKCQTAIITGNFKMYSAASRGVHGGQHSRTALRNQMSQLTNFEALIFSGVQASFVDCDYQLGTLDDEVLDCHASDTQVKYSNDRKADG